MKVLKKLALWKQVILLIVAGGLIQIAMIYMTGFLADIMPDPKREYPAYFAGMGIYMLYTQWIAYALIFFLAWKTIDFISGRLWKKIALSLATCILSIVFFVLLMLMLTKMGI